MARIQHVSLENYRNGIFYPADVAIRIVDNELLFGQDHHGMITNRFVFSDVDEACSGAIQPEQAENILEILQEAQRTGQDVLVHCVAGVSRSGAVAQFAIDYLGFEDANSQSDWRLPNIAVLKALKHALLGNDCPFFRD